MEQQPSRLKQITGFLWAIVGTIGAIVGAIFLMRKNPDSQNVLTQDQDLQNQQDEIDNQIQDIKDDIDSVDTSNMSNGDVADYFNKKGRL